MAIAFSLSNNVFLSNDIPEHRVIDVHDFLLPPSLVKNGMRSRNLVIFEDGSSVLNYQGSEGVVGYPVSSTMTDHLLISAKANLELKLFEGPTTWWQKITGQHWEYQLQNVISSQEWLHQRNVGILDTIDLR